MKRRLSATLLASTLLLSSGCASIVEGVASIPVVNYVLGYPLLILTLGPGMMLLSATSPYFSTPRAASWSSLDDGPLRRSYIVVGISGHKQNPNSNETIQIIPEQGNPCGFYGVRIGAPETAEIAYQIYEAPPGTYHAAFSSNVNGGMNSSFKVGPGEIVYLGDYQFGQMAPALASSFDALYQFASRYQVDLTRLAKAETKPSPFFYASMCSI